MHIYHFLITDKIIIELNNINELKKYSISGKINFILKKSNNILKYFSNLNINEHSKVEYLDSKKDFQLYIKEKLFKKLKYYHGVYNSYSLAQYVRMIIKLFIKTVKKYGYDMALKKIKKEAKNLKKLQSIQSKKFLVIQLLSYLGIKKNKNLKLCKILIILLL